MTATDLDSLAAAVYVSSLDATLRRVYADAFEEAGKIEEAGLHRSIADVLDNPLNADLAGRVRAAVKKANGKMRARTVRESEALNAVIGAVADFARNDEVPARYRDGGGVANSYGYAAQTALVLVVVRKDGKVCVDGGQAQARKGGGSPANVWRELVQWKEGKQLDARLKAWAASR